jgi:hypothetical protein
MPLPSIPVHPLVGGIMELDPAEGDFFDPARARNYFGRRIAPGFCGNLHEMNESEETGRQV